MSKLYHSLTKDLVMVKFRHYLGDEMKPIDLSKLLIKYKKGWVALTPDSRRFLASAKSLKAVMERAKKMGVNNPSVFKPAPVKNFSVG